MASNIRVILLDLGGVLLELRDPFETFGLKGDRAQFLKQWLLSPSVRELECGRMSPEKFSEAAVSEFELDYDAEEFMIRFRDWPKELFAGVPALLQTLRERYPVALLSNTNAVHWNRQDIAGVLTPLLDHIFLSYETGLLKPDAHAFDAVADQLRVEPSQIVFLDDNPLNVEAAQNGGMRALLTHGLDSLTSNLSSEELL